MALSTALIWQPFATSSLNNLSLSDPSTSEASLALSLQKSDKSIETHFGDFRYSTVPEMLSALEVTTYPEDIITAFPPPAMRLGAKIEILRAPVISVKDGTTSVVYRSWADTVEQFLTEKKIVLAKADRLSPPLDAQIMDGSLITINRIAIEELKVREVLDFSSERRDDAELERGKTRVVQKGTRGVREKTFRIVREDGLEIGRSLIGNTVVEAPQAEIIAVGTKLNFVAVGKASHVGSIYSAGQAAYRGLRGKRVIVKNLTNGREVEVRIIDYGPDARVHPDRVIDLSRADFMYLAPGVSGIISQVGIAVID